MDSTLLFLFTGGTIDSFYDGRKDAILPHENSILPNYLRGLNLYNCIESLQICMKDSRALTKEDRLAILDVLEKTPHAHVIITHGTYTMPDTAQFLKVNLKRSDQTIVLTGAMVPHEIPNSDGPFNLGYAVAEVKHLPSGVYIAMNGRIFNAEEAAKDIAQGKFISLFNTQS